MKQEAQAAQNARRTLDGQTFTCPEEAQAAVAAVQPRWQSHHAEAEVVPLTRSPAPGRPAQGATPDLVGYQL